MKCPLTNNHIEKLGTLKLKRESEFILCGTLLEVLLVQFLLFCARVFEKERERGRNRERETDRKRERERTLIHNQMNM